MNSPSRRSAPRALRRSSLAADVDTAPKKIRAWPGQNRLRQNAKRDLGLPTAAQSLLRGVGGRRLEQANPSHYAERFPDSLQPSSRRSVFLPPSLQAKRSKNLR